MVRKSDGGHTVCIDFRKLNEVAKKDVYPMKNISEILDKLSSAKYISKIDLSQAFHQIPLAEESKELTAFPVPGKGLSTIIECRTVYLEHRLDFNGYWID